MKAHEVVIREVESDRSLEIIQLFGKRIGQPGETAHVHPHRQILALNVGCADVLWVRIAHYNLAFTADALGWRIPFFGLFRCPVNLLECGEVYVHPERAYYRFQVCFVAVCSDLYADLDAAGAIIHEILRPNRAATAHKVAHY